jgi:hypothetical protein
MVCEGEQFCRCTLIATYPSFMIVNEQPPLMILIPLSMRQFFLKKGELVSMRYLGIYVFYVESVCFYVESISFYVEKSKFYVEYSRKRDG